MSQISELLGERIKNLRKQKGMSQEKLSELANLHSTYIGQLERGEKNPSIETVFKICAGLEIPVSCLLENIDGYNFYGCPTLDSTTQKNNIPLMAYELFFSETPTNQKLLYEMLLLTKRYGEGNKPQPKKFFNH